MLAYLRIKKSVRIFSLGRSLVQPVIRPPRIVHIDVCMTARQDKGKDRDIPRFHHEVHSILEEGLHKNAISKPACRTFICTRHEKLRDVIITIFGNGVHFRVSKWKMTLPERMSDLSHARLTLGFRRYALSHAAPKIDNLPLDQKKEKEKKKNGSYIQQIWEMIAEVT